MSESPEKPGKPEHFENTEGSAPAGPAASETPPPTAPVPPPRARSGRLRVLVGAVPLAVVASGLLGGLVGGGVVALVADVGDDDDRGHHRVIRFHEEKRGDRERGFPRRFHHEGPGRWEDPRSPGDGTVPRFVPPLTPATPATPSPTPAS